MLDKKPTAEAPAQFPNPTHFPNVDRLIELGSDKDEKGSAEPKEPQEKSLWKLLLQLRPLLPYLARLVPVLDVAVAPLQNAGLSSDVRNAVAKSMADSTAKLQSAQRELSSAVTSALDEQSLALKHLEDELTGLREASEKFAAAQASLAEDLRSLTRLLQIAALGGAILLVALIVMSAVLLTRH